MTRPTTLPTTDAARVTRTAPAARRTSLLSHRRRAVALVGVCLGFALPTLAAMALDGTVPDAADPYQSLPWVDMRALYLGTDPVSFDPRVRVTGPSFAEDPMNVPISVAVQGIERVDRIVVLVDRNPIRKVLEYQPLTALPQVSFRFKLEQASPVRAAVHTADGRWHVGGTWVDSAGGGCTVSGATRKDGSWAQTLGLVSARVFEATPVPEASPALAANGSSRVRVRVMHPMDTGLVSGVPAFYLSKLALRDAAGRELLRLQTFEPVSENPVFSFDFAPRPSGVLRLTGVDNNGNRIDSAIE
ncbi:MAG: quinoprotein dehydrogenase-associated SoxYZ-like carrier [Leptothrix sp. (in: b-proteobacteria)]